MILGSLRVSALAGMLSLLTSPAGAVGQESPVFRQGGVEAALPSGFPMLRPFRSDVDTARHFGARSQDGASQVRIRIEEFAGTGDASELDRRSALEGWIERLLATLPGGRPSRVDSLATAEYLSAGFDFGFTAQGTPLRGRMQVYVSRSGPLRTVVTSLMAPAEPDPLGRPDVARLFAGLRLHPHSGAAEAPVVHPIGREGFQVTLPAGFGPFEAQGTSGEYRAYFATDGDVTVVALLNDAITAGAAELEEDARLAWLRGQPVIARILQDSVAVPDHPDYLAVGGRLLQRSDDGRPARSVVRAYLPRRGSGPLVQVQVLRVGDGRDPADDPAWESVLGSLAAAPRRVPDAAEPTAQGGRRVGRENLLITLPDGFSEFSSPSGPRDASRVYRATRGDLVVLVQVSSSAAELFPGAEGEERRTIVALATTMLPGRRALRVPDGPHHLAAGATFTGMPDLAGSMRGVARVYVPRTGPIETIAVFIMRPVDRADPAADAAWGEVLDSVRPASP